MTELEFTGERFVPEKSPARLEAQHRSRYEFAIQNIRDRDVIDIGCGEGYGSYMMIGAAKSVVGVDISKRAIEHAKEMYESTNLHYKVADVAKLPFDENKFTAGVCFEVIEHIENPGDLLREAERVIAPNGIFIVSTPNGAVRTSSQKSKFHVKEFNIREFREMLEKHFPKSKWYVTIYGQFDKGKTYSRAKVLIKNIYLGAKGALGIKPKEQPVGSSDQSRAVTQYRFDTEDAELAEFLIAVVRWRE